MSGNLKRSRVLQTTERWENSVPHMLLPYSLSQTVKEAFYKTRTVTHPLLSVLKRIAGLAHMSESHVFISGTSISDAIFAAQLTTLYKSSLEKGDDKKNEETFTTFTELEELFRRVASKRKALFEQVKFQSKAEDYDAEAILKAKGLIYSFTPNPDGDKGDFGEVDLGKIQSFLTTLQSDEPGTTAPTMSGNKKTSDPVEGIQQAAKAANVKVDDEKPTLEGVFGKKGYNELYHYLEKVMFEFATKYFKVNDVMREEFLAKVNTYPIYLRIFVRVIEQQTGGTLENQSIKFIHLENNLNPIIYSAMVAAAEEITTSVDMYGLSMKPRSVRNIDAMIEHKIMNNLLVECSFLHFLDAKLLLNPQETGKNIKMRKLKRKTFNRKFDYYIRSGQL